MEDVIFEDIPNDPLHVKCLPCSAFDAKKDRILLRDSVRGHKGAAVHKSALVKWFDERAQPAEMSAAELEALEPAALSFADMFAHSDDGGSERARSPHNAALEEFHSSFIDYGDEIADRDGQPVQFTAGESENTREEAIDRLRDQLAALEHDHGHTIFVQTASEYIDERAEPPVENPSLVADAVAALQALGMEDDEEDDYSNEQAPEESGWEPHGSMVIFLLDMMDNLPRLRLSDDLLKVFLGVLKKLGVRNVPSFSAFRRKQAELTAMVSVPTKHHTSALQNHFYVNHPARLVALDFSNPRVRPLMHFLPEIGEKRARSEFWQFEKWTQVPVSESQHRYQQQMWADFKHARYRHFYVRELARLENGQFVIPWQWVAIDGEVHALAYRVEVEKNVEPELEGDRDAGRVRPEYVFRVRTDTLERVSFERFAYNVVELASIAPIAFARGSPAWTAQVHNPQRDLAKGKLVFASRIMLWADDVSGNRSKQYNAHVNVYGANLTLPHKVLAQEYFVRFYSTSQNASSSEQFAALDEDFQDSTLHEAYDCHLQTDVLFTVVPHVLPADNPQQAENCSHAGSQTNHYCRYDTVGGKAAVKEEDHEYDALFAPGSTKRSATDTVATIEMQIRLACRGVKSPVEALVTTTGVKDKIAQHWIGVLLARAREEQTLRVKDHVGNLHNEERVVAKEEIVQTIADELLEWLYRQPQHRFDALPVDSPLRKQIRAGCHYNPLFAISGLNPHADSPIEGLHTFFLGPRKYIWHSTNKVWDKKKEELFAARLQSSITDGLSILSLRARYLVQYKNSLVGKHLKILQQLAVFHLLPSQGLCDDAGMFDLWKALGDLGAMLWYPEIANVQDYIDDLRVLVGNVLDIWASLDAQKIITKYKLHVLAHVLEDILRFGPIILYSTELFECWNAIFRLCSVYSNHLSPSHDIAETVAGMERFRHIVSGGWWKTTDGQDMQCGPRIRAYFSEDRDLQRRLGWVEETRIEPGTVKLQSKKKRGGLLWQSAIQAIYDTSQLYNAEREPLPIPETDPDGSKTWFWCKTVVARSGDPCLEGSFIFFSQNQSVEVGRIVRILNASQLDLSGSQAALIVEHFVVQQIPHAHLNMPIILRSRVPAAVITPEAALFKFNVQHDCSFMQCPIQPVDPVRQERYETSQLQNKVVCTDRTRYIINMHSLHNPHLLRQTLPRELTKPVPFREDRRAFHDGLAAQLRIDGPTKRAQAVIKAAETRAANKAAKEAAAAKSAQAAADKAARSDAQMHGDK